MSHANLAVGFSKPYPVPAIGRVKPKYDDAQVAEICGLAPVRGNSSHARKTLTFAIDLDGTLIEINTQPGKFAGGLPRPNAINVCKRLYNAGHVLLVDTVRPDEWYVKGWLAENFQTGLRDGIGNPKPMFSGINCNPADVARHGIVAGHLYADVYINDKSWIPGREHGQQVDWYELEKDCEARSWI